VANIIQIDCNASVKKINKMSYVICHQPKSFDWGAGGSKSYPPDMINDALHSQVCDRVGVNNALFKRLEFCSMKVDMLAVATHLLQNSKRVLTQITGFFLNLV